MDKYELTKIVLTRIQTLDPENASKIMGYILIQDYEEKDMMKLAFGEETLLISLINQAKTCLGFSSNGSSAPSAPSSPSPFNPISNPVRPNPFPQSSPRIIIPNNGFHLNSSSLSPSSPWSGSAFSEQYRSPRPGSGLSYAAVVNGSTNNSNPPGFSFFGNNSNSDIDSGYNGVQAQDSLAFLDDFSIKNVTFIDPIVSPSGQSDSVLFPYGHNAVNWVDSGSTGDIHHPHPPFHRRSYSVNDAFLGGGGGSGGGGGCGFEDGGAGYGWRPCMYYAKGFCKNGSSCKFLHGGVARSPEGEDACLVVGSPGKVDGLDELHRFKAIEQQRFAGESGHHFPYNKCTNIFNQNQRSAAAALVMGEELHKFGRCGPERNEFAAMGLGGNANSSLRQIYLTFPADSMFKEEDVSKYFSMYGPVQDVRIPYQHKRMFGFVTFMHPQTVKIILAKGNPHFVCDSRVLVKPYKEKGKVLDKKQQQQQQQMLWGEFSTRPSPSAFGSRESFDHIPFGARMYYNAQKLISRRKIEQEAELQQAIELQAGAPIPSPSQSYNQINQSLVLPADGVGQEVDKDKKDSPEAAKSPTGAIDTKALVELDIACNKTGSEKGNGKEENSIIEDIGLDESLEHILPDNLFSSPTKSAVDCDSLFFASFTEAEDSVPVISSNIVPTLPSGSTLNMDSHKSCYVPMSSHSNVGNRGEQD